MFTSIPDTTLEKFTTFGDLLRFLRRRAGLTQMELSIAVGYSDAQISRLEQNLRLPDIPMVEARFVPALSLEHEPNVIARLLDLAANVRREDAPGLGLCPYKGLSYFDEADADLFVGREALTNKLAQRVFALASSSLPNETRFLAVVGASGSGKSSLVRAGLIPALRWNKRSADWKICIFTPTVRPLESLATGLTHETESVSVTAALMDDLGRDPRSLHLFVTRKLQSENSTHLLLVVDQFEETFALCRSEGERAAFIGNLLTAASETGGPVIVLITLRADFYDRCANYPQLREALTVNQEYIGAMGEDELRRAIEEPASNGRWEFEPGLVDLLLHDVENEPGALPLLSHALLETWERRRGRTLTLSGYASSGGVRGAIAETAETVFTDQLTKEQQSLARRIFLRLTELGDEASTADTRRRAKFDELILKPEEASDTRAVLKKLADARLIITTEDSAEVAHEALIREWPTLRGWLEENRESLRLHRQLTESAQGWLAMERTPDMLYRGARLVQIQEWASLHADDLNALEREFLEASIEISERRVAEREAQRQRELEAARKLAKAEKQRAEAESQRAEEQTKAAAQLQKRALYLVGAFTIALIMALTALFFGARARQAAVQAQTQQHVATSRELAAASISNLDLDPERSILLALSAVAEAQSASLPVPREAEEALHRAVFASQLRMSRQTGFSVDFSPDGKLIAFSGPDSTVIIQDFPSGEEKLVLSGHSGDSYGVSVHFSFDGKRLITTSADGTAKIWDVLTGKDLVTLQGHTATLFDGIFNSDGNLVATSSGDGTVRVWDSVSGDELFQVQLPEPGGIAFDPEGRYLAVTDASLFGGSIEIWDLSSGQKKLTLGGHEQGTYDVAFTLDGTRLVSVGKDHKIKLWDTSSGEELLLLVDTAPFYALAISPDGDQIATGGEDGVAKVWDAESGELLRTLKGHTDTVSHVAFSPDSKYLATSSFDRTTKVWDISPEGNAEQLSLVGHTRVIMDAEYSPDGQKIATGSWDGTASIWDANTGENLLTLEDIDGEVGGIAFSPDQTQIATADYTGTIKTWDAETSQSLLSFLAHETPGDIDVAFSPDGKIIGSGGSDGVAKLWNADTGELIHSFEGHTDVIMRIAFSPEGNRLATASWDGTAKIWDIASGQNTLTLSADAGSVLNVDFSPDGNLLATAYADGTARIWDISAETKFQNNERLLHTLVGHSNSVWDATFSPDGTRLATGGFDGTIRLWDVESGLELLVLAENSAGPNLDFSPDGKFLVLAGGDGIVRVFILTIDDLVDLANFRLTRALTIEECQQYLHQDTCPGNE